MTKRPGDDTPGPEGGRAAERLREFYKARTPEDGTDEVLPGEDSRDQQTDESEADGSGQSRDNS